MAGKKENQIIFHAGSRQTAPLPLAYRRFIVNRVSSSNSAYTRVKPDCCFAD
jgi:hypothetical protein